MKLTIDVTPDQEKQLAEAAQRLNVAIEDLAGAALRDLLQRSAPDFEQALERVLSKNAELYRRLA